MAVGSLCGGKRSHSAQQFVKFVGRVEIRFEFAGAEFFANIVDSAGEKVERSGQHFLVGENNIAPGGVRTAGKTQGIPQTRPCKRNGQAVFIKAIIQKRTEGDCRELRQMRGETNGVVVLLGTDPEWACADFL